MKVGSNQLTVWRLVLVTAVVFGLLGAMQGRALAANGDPLPDGRYQNEDFGFTLSWDADLWEGSVRETDNNMTGVNLSDQMSIAYFMMGETDEKSTSSLCFDHQVGYWESIDPDMTTAPATVERPKLSIAGAKGDLFRMTIGNAQSAEDVYAYFACASILDGSAGLEVTMIATIPGYPGELPRWSDLFDRVELEQGEDSFPIPAHVPALSQSYQSEDGYSVTYNGSIWSFELDGGTAEFSSDEVGAFVTAIEAAGRLTDCPAVTAETWVGTDLVESAESAASSLDRPEPAQRAASGLYITKTSGDNQKFVLYAECRKLDCTYFLRIEMIAGYSDYTDNLLRMQRLLDGISIPSIT